MKTASDPEISGYVAADPSAAEGQYVALWQHGAFVFGKMLRHNRWWLAKSVAPGEDASLARQLRREFELAVNLDHPGIVRVIDFCDILGAGDSIIMEWVDGLTLDQWLDHPHRRREKEKVWRGILEAVAHMHSAGIVHGDIKPTNIMVASDGRPRVIDLGLGNAPWMPQTCTGGSEGFSAPEQMAGAPADRRADVYALGMVLRRLGIHKAVAAKATNTDPDARYADASALLRATAADSRMKWLIAACSGLLVVVGLLAWAILADKPDAPAPRSARASTVLPSEGAANPVDGGGWALPVVGGGDGATYTDYEELLRLYNQYRGILGTLPGIDSLLRDVPRDEYGGGDGDENFPADDEDADPNLFHSVEDLYRLLQPNP